MNSEKIMENLLEDRNKGPKITKKKKIVKENKKIVKEDIDEFVNTAPYEEGKFKPGDRVAQKWNDFDFGVGTIVEDLGDDLYKIDWDEPLEFESWSEWGSEDTELGTNLSYWVEEEFHIGGGYRMDVEGNVPESDIDYVGREYKKNEKKKPVKEDVYYPHYPSQEEVGKEKLDRLKERLNELFNFEDSKITEGDNYIELINSDIRIYAETQKGNITHILFGCPTGIEDKNYRNVYIEYKYGNEAEEIYETIMSGNAWDWSEKLMSELETLIFKKQQRYNQSKEDNKVENKKFIKEELISSYRSAEDQYNELEAEYSKLFALRKKQKEDLEKTESDIAIILDQIDKLDLSSDNDSVANEAIAEDVDKLENEPICSNCGKEGYRCNCAFENDYCPECEEKWEDCVCQGDDLSHYGDMFDKPRDEEAIKNKGSRLGKSGIFKNKMGNKPVEEDINYEDDVFNDSFSDWVPDDNNLRMKTLVDKKIMLGHNQRRAFQYEDGTDVIIPAGTVLEYFEDKNTTRDLEDIVEDANYWYYSFPEGTRKDLKRAIEEAGMIPAYPYWDVDELEVYDG